MLPKKSRKRPNVEPNSSVVPKIDPRKVSSRWTPAISRSEDQEFEVSDIGHFRIEKITIDLQSDLARSDEELDLDAILLLDRGYSTVQFAWKHAVISAKNVNPKDTRKHLISSRWAILI